MKSVSLISYIKSSVEDEYAMNVFYGIVKESFARNDFSLSNLSSLYIDGRFFGEDINITLRAKYNKTPKHVLALLLSIRLLMLNPKLVKFCNDDNLIITSRIEESFQWVEFMAFILDNWEDEEIKILYSMLEDYHFDEKFTDDEKKEFQETILMPEYRNERAYYKELAKSTSGVSCHVIGNCAFLESNIIDKYVVTKDIEYVGDTAFSYCENLETLVFEDKVLFGVFPIIECLKLRQIIVPTSLVDYYKEELKYYEDIISDCEITKPEDIKDGRTGTRPNRSEIKEPERRVGDGTVIKKEIDYKTLESVFDKKATSYKYFWFVSLISLAKESGKLVVPYKDIVIRMAALAWPIIFEYDIALNKIDMLPKYLEEITRKTKLIKSASSSVVNNYLTQHYNSQGIDKILTPLLKNVPYRFLSPWIPFTTNEEVVEKSQSSNYPCLYSLHENVVVLDEDWWEYIDENYDSICEFSKNSFVNYVKQFNNHMQLLKFLTNGWSLK